MPFTVMTWNVENLFMPGHTDALPQSDFNDKLDLISGTVQLLDPDVVAFQELGNGALGALQQALNPTYPAARESIPDTRGIRVGILSKHAFVSQADLRDFPATVPNIFDENGTQITRMGRGAPHVEVQFGALNVHIISTKHLKSELLTFPGGFFSTNDETLRAQIGAIALNKRAAEATTIRLAVNAILANSPGHAVVVMGDLNDGPSAATSQLLLGPPGSEIGTLGFSRPDPNARLGEITPDHPPDTSTFQV